MGSDTKNTIDELVNEDVDCIIERMKPMLIEFIRDAYRHGVMGRGLVVYPENDDLLDKENR